VANIVERTDMRMVQRRNRSRFAVEALLGFRVLGKMGRKDLDGDCAVENRFCSERGRRVVQSERAGGIPVAITQTSLSVNHRFPYFLPDGRHFLFTYAYSKDGKDGIYLGSLNSPEIKLISPEPSSDAAYASGYLLLVREGKLWAQPFDVRGLRVTGEPFLVADGVRWAFDRRAADFSVANNGMLVFLSTIGSGQRLVWFDREGREQGVAVPDIGNPTSGLMAGTLSPESDRVAVARARGAGSDIWIYNLKTALGTRLTFTDDFNESPVWSSDGKSVVFTRNLTDHYELRLKSVSGAGEEQVLVKTPGNVIASEWSHDGRYLFYGADIFAASGKTQGLALPMSGNDRRPITATSSTGNVFPGYFSPDDKWLAYISDESGPFEIYATTFPAHAGKWQLSTAGVDGLGVLWVGKGPETEVIYRDLQSHLISVPVREEGASLSRGAPRVLLGGRSLASSRFIDVSRDGRRILVGLPQENASTPLTLLLNWTENLRR
jgi:hypothetical protein